MITSEQLGFLEFIIDNHISRLHPQFRSELIKYFSETDNLRFLNGLTKKLKHYVLQTIREHIGATLLPSGTSITSKKYYEIRGWSKEESIELAKKAINDRNKENSPYNYLYWVMLGKTIEEAHFEVKSRRPFNKEYWIKKGLSTEEAKIKVSDLQKRLSKNSNDQYSSSRTSTQIDYWIKRGFSLEESKFKVAQRQKSATLNELIKKYGLRKGILKKLKHKGISINFRRDILTAYCMCDKTEEGFKKSQDLIRKNKKGHASKESLRLFEPFYFATVNYHDIRIGAFGKHEYKLEFLDEELNNKFYRYDFTIIEPKIIIEYDGWYFHTSVKDGGISPQNGHEYCNFAEFKKQKMVEDLGFKVYRVSNKDDFLSNIRKVYEILDGSGVKLQNKIFESYPKHKKALEGIYDLNKKD